MTSLTSTSVVDHIVDILAEFGVKKIYGIPGDAINDLMDAVRRKGNIQFVQVRHEETGAFAAAAHAKLTGKIGVCVGTAGGGAIHLLNALYDAKMDHAPVLAITGQLPRDELGNDSHQEINSDHLFNDVSVFNRTLVSVSSASQTVVRACRAALSDKGVAHLALPADIASAKVDEDHTPILKQQSFKSNLVVEKSIVEEASHLINKAGKIVILAGVGAMHAREELIQFAEKIKAPIVRSLKAKALISDQHPLSLGGLGLLGTRPSLDAIQDCDLLVTVGTDFPYQEYYPKNSTIIQINNSPNHIGRRCNASLALNGDSQLTLKQLIALVSEEENTVFLNDYQNKKAQWDKKQETKEKPTGTPIKPQYLAKMVGEVANDDAIFLCDTGTVTAWVARHLAVKETQKFVLSGNLATMAFALGGAIGAQMEYPEKQVIALMGDGGFSMLMQDFITAVEYKLPIKFIIFNNAKLGLIEVEQETSGYPSYQIGLNNPDFAEFAKLCGSDGYTVSEPSDLSGILDEALSSSKPCIVDVHIDPDELIMPPKIGFDQALNYSLAKIKEFVAK